MAGAHRAAGQTGAPLVGPARDIARDILIAPAVFDPLLTLPLTPAPQAVVESHGRDVSGTVHVGLRNGDDSYGITLSGPLSQDEGTASVVDPRAVRGHTFLGVDLTNVIWRPKASAPLEQQLGSAGALRLTPESRAAVARAIATTDAVAAPWAVFLNFNYRFSRDQYTYTGSAGGGQQQETHLNDIASAMVGLQVLARRSDPGYFLGVSYIYSAVFREADEQTVQLHPPVKTRANLLRVEVRRLLGFAHLGVTPSWTYDLNSRVATVDTAAYVLFAPINRASSRPVRFYAGIRAGHQTAPGGGFVTVFVGPAFGAR